MNIINILADGTICKDLSKVKVPADVTARMKEILVKGLRDDKTGKA